MKLTNKENINLWSKNCNEAPESFFQSYKEEGDFWHKNLLNDNILGLLGDVENKSILDAGCGEGYFSRILAKRNAKVISVEPSTLIDYAQKYEDEEKLGINYIQDDLKNFSDYDDCFDAIISINVLMDVAELDAVLLNCYKKLKSGGSFVFSVLHPCFTQLIKENNELKKISNCEEKGLFTTEEYFIEKPIRQNNDFYFHRTLSTYINLFIALGFSIEKMIEPRLDESFETIDNKIYRDCHIPRFLILKAVKR